MRITVTVETDGLRVTKTLKGRRAAMVNDIAKATGFGVFSTLGLIVDEGTNHALGRVERQQPLYDRRLLRDGAFVDSKCERHTARISTASINGRSATITTDSGWYELTAYATDARGNVRVFAEATFLSYTDALDAGEAWERKGVWDAHKAVPHQAPGSRLYLLNLWGDVEPELSGPFKDEQDRVEAAQDYRRAHGDEDGLFRVDASGSVKVDTFTGAELEPHPRRCTLCKCTATGERFGFAVCPYHVEATEDDPPCPKVDEWEER